MLTTIAIENYRSLRNLRLPLGQLNVVTGANGTGKSSLSALRLADVPGRVISSSLVRVDSVRAVADPSIAGGSLGSISGQGTARLGRSVSQLGFASDDSLSTTGLPDATQSSRSISDPDQT